MRCGSRQMRRVRSANGKRKLAGERELLDRRITELESYYHMTSQDFLRAYALNKPPIQKRGTDYFIWLHALNHLGFDDCQPTPHMVLRICDKLACGCHAKTEPAK